MLTRTDTIAAIATAAGRGAIAVVRLSGRDALEIARRMVTPMPAAARTAVLATIHSPNAPDEVIDRGVVTWFKGPASYTGEDVVELAVHGGAMVSALVLEACVAAGARPALAGEFTERAVLNGKMDLVQAEGVADLIDARSRAAHRAAVQQLDGALSKRLNALREALLKIDALIAYDIDFPEEDEAAPSRARVAAACDEAIGQVERLLATLPAAALGREGALVVLAGPPNSGKSSLLNALVGEARVIVSEVPGTTRDAVEVLVDDSPFPLRLVDTAGLRESGDLIERMGIEVSERYVAQAHVVLGCAENAEELARTVALVEGMTRGSVIPVLTKMDISGSVPFELAFPSLPRGPELALPSLPRRPEERGGPRRTAFEGCVEVSSVSGVGLAALRQAIRASVLEQVAVPDSTPLVTRARHSAALRRAEGELRAFRAAWVTGGLPAPVVATHLRGAVTALEELIGAVDVEDVLERVFRSFCVGK